MKKLKERSVLRQLVTVWGFLLLAVISGFIGMQAYVNNSKEAKVRYDNLLAVDAAGGDVEASLLNLRSYIYAHMNTTIGSSNGIHPPIQLKGTYDRLVVAEQLKLKQSNDDLYNKAQKECEVLFPEGLSGKGRVPCITEYVTKNAAKETTIPEGLYKYDFVSPIWSLDLAGISILFTGLFTVVFALRLLTYRSMLHHSHMSQ